MRAALSAGVLLLLLPSGAHAQQQGGGSRITVTGVVLDSVTGRPVPTATVSFRNARRVAFTDSLGRFSVDALPGAGEEIQARQLGYANAAFQAEIRADSARFRIYLKPDPVRLQAITARADRSGRYTIEGTVVDSATGRPLPRAVVWFRTSRGTALTDTLGHYVYDGARAGYEDVVVDVLGYDRRVAYRRVEEPWQRLDLALRPDSLVLRATAGLLRRMRREGVRSLRTHVYTEQDLARSGLRTVRRFLIWLGFDGRLLTTAARVRTRFGLEPALEPAQSLAALHAEVYAEMARMLSDDPTPGSPPQSVLVDGVHVQGGVRRLADLPLSDFYMVVVAMTPGTARNAMQTPPGISLYSKKFMRQALRSGVRPRWQTPADSLPDAWVEGR